MTLTSNTFDPSELDPGIRDIVVALREAGFDTTDSGDGSKYGKMECARDHRHVDVCLPFGTDETVALRRAFDLYDWASNSSLVDFPFQVDLTKTVGEDQRYPWILHFYDVGPVLERGFTDPVFQWIETLEALRKRVIVRQASRVFCDECGSAWDEGAPEQHEQDCVAKPFGS